MVVSGCGRVGAQVAETFSLEGHDVAVVDRNPESLRRLGPAFTGITVEGVSFDEEALREAGIENADIFLALTNSDSTNLMASEIAKGIFGVRTVMSRLYYPEHELTFFKMGIDYVCSTTLISGRIRRVLFQPEEITVDSERLDLGIQLVEFKVPESARGIPASELNSGISSKVIAVLHGNQELRRGDSSVLEAGDRVLIALRKEGWKIIGKYIKITSPLLIPPVNAAEAPDERPKIIVGGCSSVGAHIAFILSMEGFQISVIDEDPEKFKRLPESYTGDVLEGVAYDIDPLVSAGIEKALGFVSVTKFDNKNMMAAEVAREVFHVPHVVSRLFNPDKERTYQALGLRYVCGTRLLVQELLDRILEPKIRRVSPCFNNLLEVVEFTCPKTWDHRTIASISDKYGIEVAYVARRNTGYLPEENFELRAGDQIAALVGEHPQRKLEKELAKL
ncbi:MAG: NAD-binding protein [Actinomycetota bacterium]|nr:NAD-binding protein [Actinomycetota bacterium]